MLEIIRDLFMDSLQDYPWWRRVLLIAALAAFVFWGVMSWKGFAIWSAIFLLYEIAGLIFPPKRRH